GLVVSAVNAGMGLPPVVVGLVVTILLWRSGPFGALEILYTPDAIVLAQTVIAAPIVTGITLAAVQQVPREFRVQLLALGASRVQMVWVVLREARLPMLAAVMAGFGGVISEVGASMMVGGSREGPARCRSPAADRLRRRRPRVRLQGSRPALRAGGGHPSHARVRLDGELRPPAPPGRPGRRVLRRRRVVRDRARGRGRAARGDADA